MPQGGGRGISPRGGRVVGRKRHRIVAWRGPGDAIVILQHLIVGWLIASSPSCSSASSQAGIFVGRGVRLSSGGEEEKGGALWRS